MKLFTKRVQLREPVDPEVYAAAPWWEQRIFDGGERVLRVKGEVQLSAYPSRFMNSLIVAVTSTVLAVGMGTLTAYGFSRFRVPARTTGCSSSSRPACCRRWWWRSRCS